MKLGLYKQLVRNGEDNEPVFNGSATGNKLFDVKIEGMLKLSTNDKGTFCLLSINTMGCLVYLIKPLFSRMGDYRAWVISVPRQVVLSSSNDLPTIVMEAQKALEAGEEPQSLARWFQRDYKEQDFTFSLPEYRSKYAYRLYGRDSKVASLSQLLGANMLQKDYFDYEGVFLVDAARQSMVRAEAMDDLSQKMLRQPAVVIPPQTAGLPDGVSLTAGKEKFDLPILSYKGARFKVSVKRPGYLDVEQMVTVPGNVFQVMLPAKVDWRYKVYPDIFSVVGEDGQALRDASVEIEGNTGVDHKERCVVVPEANAKKARITVKHEGCGAKTMTADLTLYTPEEPLMIKMKMKRNKVKYKVGSKISFEMDRTDDEMEESPLAGYEVSSSDGNVVTLKSTASGRKSAKKKGKSGEEGKQGGRHVVSKMAIIRICVGLLAGLLIGGATGWWLGRNHGESSVRKEVEAQRLAELKRNQEIADSIENVRMAAYLDSIPNWKKAELDSVFDGKLAGLYDALNTYDFATVQEKGQEHDLDVSTQWHLLDSVLSLMNEKVEYGKKLVEITKNEGEDGKKFYSPDGTITLATFMNKLEEARVAVDSQKP